MPRYLLTMSDEEARKLEPMFTGRIEIVPSAGTLAEHEARGLDGAVIAGLDAVTEEEIMGIRARLTSSGPLYHHGGPGGARQPVTGPALQPGTRIITLPAENGRVIITYQAVPSMADQAAVRAWFSQAGLPEPLILVAAQVSVPEQPAVLYGPHGMEVRLRVAVEAKDEYYPDSLSSGVPQPGVLPAPEQVGAVAGDLLCDDTKRNVELGWRVTRVVHA